MANDPRPATVRPLHRRSALRAAAGALASWTAGQGPHAAFAEPAPGTAAAPKPEPAPPRLTPFGPADAPFHEAARRDFAADTLRYLWELHGLRASRPIFSLPSTPVLGTRWEVGARHWDFTVPAGFPIYLIAYASVDLARYDPSLTAVTLDGAPLTGLRAYLYSGLRAPVHTEIFDHAIADLVFAPPVPGTYRVGVRRVEFETEYVLTVAEPLGLGPRVLRDSQGTCYVTHAQWRRVIPDQDTILALGFSPDRVVAASDEAIALLPEGPPLPPLREGMLVRGGGQVFRLSGGRRVWLGAVPNGTLAPPGEPPAGPGAADPVEPAGAAGPADPAEPPLALDDAVVAGIPLDVQGDVLVMSAAGDVYRSEDGDLRRVPDWEWLTARGLRPGDALRVPDHLFKGMSFNGAQGQPAGVSHQDLTFASAVLGAEMPYRLYLPPGYAAAGQRARRYPVLYLLHGRGAHYDEWTDYGVEEQLNRLAASLPGAAGHVIVVQPQGGLGYWGNQPGNTRWADYLAGDLVAHVDRTYRTLPVREARGLGGLSMGAFGALLNGLTLPDRFGVVGARGPALYTRESSLGFFGGAATFTSYDPITLAGTATVAKAPAFWLDVGDDDYWKDRVLLLRDTLRQRGWSCAWTEYPGSHTQKYWGAHVDAFIDFFVAAFAAAAGSSRLVAPAASASTA